MFCRFAKAARCLTWHYVLLSAVCLVAGCSGGSDAEPRSVLDSLARVEKAKKEMTEPPVIPPTVEPSSEPSSEMSSMVQPTGTYKVKFETSAGDFTLLVHRDWAPLGAQRFHEMVKAGFYNECRFFRVVPGFMVQFGISGTPSVQEQWDRRISDDKVKESNKRGYITFATSGANSRTSQVFINFADNTSLDPQGFSPFGEVIEGMESVDSIHSGYGEQPNQGQITTVGNEYLSEHFPDLDYVEKATLVEE